MKTRGSRFWRAVKWSGTVACAVTVVVWLLSAGFSKSAYRWVSADQRTHLVTYCGRVGVMKIKHSLTVPPSVTERGFISSTHRLESRLASLGFVLPTVHANANPTYLRLVIPLWLVLLVLLVPTVVGWKRCRSFSVGHCRACGYDLTGNVSGTCPECGTAVMTA